MNEENPRIQCENCGKWRRLHDREGNQLMFPLIHPEHGEDLPDGLYYDSLCVWCHLLFGIVCEPFKEATEVSNGTE